MKKILSMLLVLSMLLTASAALAEGMGVQVIGGPATEAEPVSLDDIKLGVDVEIEGYGILTPMNSSYIDIFIAYKAGRNNYTEDYFSGNEAEYCVLYMDILNTTVKPKDYLSQYQVKVVFDDVYEYAGWAYQQNWDNQVWHSSGQFEMYSNKQNVLCGINSADNFAISPMYEGHYVFGCTLPNAVVNSKKPLKMIITIDGNEITYNIRK